MAKLLKRENSKTPQEVQLLGLLGEADDLKNTDTAAALEKLNKAKDLIVTNELHAYVFKLNKIPQLLRNEKRSKEAAEAQEEIGEIHYTLKKKSLMHKWEELRDKYGDDFYIEIRAGFTKNPCPYHFDILREPLPGNLETWDKYIKNLMVDNQCKCFFIRSTFDVLKNSVQTRANRVNPDLVEAADASKTSQVEAIQTKVPEEKLDVVESVNFDTAEGVSLDNASDESNITINPQKLKQQDSSTLLNTDGVNIDPVVPVADSSLKNPSSAHTYTSVQGQKQPFKRSPVSRKHSSNANAADKYREAKDTFAAQNSNSVLDESALDNQPKLEYISDSEQKSQKRENAIWSFIILFLLLLISALLGYYSIF